MSEQPGKELCLSVRDLSIAFRSGGRETLAVDRVSFDIVKGECMALVGESGSGKSVTALSILRLLPYPAAHHPSGSIPFHGRDLLKLSEREMQRVRGDDITIVFQEPMTSLNPLHTIEKQIGEILLLHRGLTGAPARARTLEVLSQVGIPDPETRLKSYPHQLSGGQRQRVMIAMALANEPDLLIADEPTTALDVTVQAQIIALLKEIQSRLHMSLLFITHDLGIVRKIAQRVCVMKDGKIVEHGAVERVFSAPEHPYTQALLAAEPRPDPAPPQPDAPLLLKTDRAQSVVSDHPRPDAQNRRPRQSLRRLDHRTAQRRDARRGRQIRLGQVDAGPRHLAADLVGRPDRLHGPRSAGLEFQGNAPVPPRHADRVPGSLRIAVAAHVGRRHHQGRPQGPSTRHARSPARRTRGSGLARRRPQSGAAFSLSP